MKVALITGASSGIGYQLAKDLANKNMIVYGISRSPFELPGVIHLKGDVTNEEEINNLVQSIIDKEGKIDYLINNAGMGISGSIEGTSVSEVEAMFKVNFIGTFIVSKAILPFMRAQKYGKIINVGSVASEFSIPFQGFYSSSKSAVKVFSEGLRNEVAPYGIHVCTVIPGDVKTSFTNNRRKNNNELKVYEKRVEKSVAMMEKDEQNGMSVEYASKIIYKVIKSKKTPVVKTIGVKYKLFVFLKRLLPTKLVNNLVGVLYAFKKER